MVEGRGGGAKAFLSITPVNALALSPEPKAEPRCCELEGALALGSWEWVSSRAPGKNHLHPLLRLSLWQRWPAQGVRSGQDGLQFSF